MKYRCYKILKDEEYYYQVNFDIPFPIYLSFDKKYSGQINGVKYEVAIEFFKKEANIGEVTNGVSSYSRDKYGFGNYSKVKVASRMHIRDYETMSYDELMDNALLAVNHIIEYYRTKNDNYWVEKVNELDVCFYSFEIRNDKDKYLECIMTGYKNKAITLAKTMYDLGKYREGIIIINSALENVVESIIKSRFDERIGYLKTDEFYDGVITYESWKLKEKYSEDEFNKFCDDGIIIFVKPGINKIMKRYIELDENIKVSKK